MAKKALIHLLIFILLPVLHKCHVILSPGIWKIEAEKWTGSPVRYNEQGFVFGRAIELLMFKNLIQMNKEQKVEGTSVSPADTKTHVRRSLIVIHEKDLSDNEKIVIGVADSIENAEKIIKEYYGNYIEKRHIDIRDSNLEYSKILEVEGAFQQTYNVCITLEWFCLNCA